jgi:hypothetical protein
MSDDPDLEKRAREYAKEAMQRALADFEGLDDEDVFEPLFARALAEKLPAQAAADSEAIRQAVVAERGRCLGLLLHTTEKQRGDVVEWLQLLERQIKDGSK